MAVAQVTNHHCHNLNKKYLGLDKCTTNVFALPRLFDASKLHKATKAQQYVHTRNHTGTCVIGSTCVYRYVLYAPSI